MTWARFHASCRRHINQAGSRIDDTLAFYQSGASSELFGPPPDARALPSRVMAHLARMPDGAAREQALGTYAGIDFDALAPEPLGVKRVVVYLALLAVVCVLMVGIIGMFVMPQMASHFEGVGMDLGHGLLAWHGFIPLMLVVIILVCSVVVLQAVALDRLVQFRFGDGRRGLLWGLLPPSLRRRYGLLEGVICAPFPDLQDPAARRELQAMQGQGLRWSDELPGLARVQSMLLVKSADRQARWLLAIMGTVVAVCISYFVLGVYTPIFRMGSGL